MVAKCFGWKGIWCWRVRAERECWRVAVRLEGVLGGWVVLVGCAATRRVEDGAGDTS